MFTQALDSDFTDANRLKCSDAAKPLLQAVDELTTFASSPEFASVPAKISLQVGQISNGLCVRVLTFWRDVQLRYLQL